MMPRGGKHASITPKNDACTVCQKAKACAFLVRCGSDNFFVSFCGFDRISFFYMSVIHWSRRLMYPLLEAVVFNRSLIFSVLFFCSVVHSAAKYHQISDEGDAPGLTIQQRLKSALSDQTSVFVIVVRKGKIFAGLYDISKEKNHLSWRLPADGKIVDMIMPAMDTFKNEALKGYKKRRFCEPRKDFSKEFECVGGAVDKLRYKRCVFFSRGLGHFLTCGCGRLKRKNKVIWDRCGQPITNNVLLSLHLPETERWSFIIQGSRDSVAEMRAAKEGDPIKVFVTLPGFGVVKGCPVPYEHWIPGCETILPSRECFLYHKVRAVGGSMRMRYPYDADQYKTCLNYGSRGFAY